MKLGEEYALFSLIALGGSIGGLAAELRSDRKLTKRGVASAMLNSGIVALVISLAWYNAYKDTNLWFLVGISILAGLGGATTLEFAVLYVRKKLGLNLPKNPTDDESQT